MSERDDLRDARVDAAWRAASREEPPPALDDAIRAAARREIGAKPRSTDASPVGVPQSLRPERWWWPLAAAATIGAMAVGLLQLVEPDHVVAPAADKAVVSDTPAALETTKPQPSPATRDATAVMPEPQAKQDAVPTWPASSSSAAPPQAASDASAAPGKPVPKLRKDVASPPPREEGARNVAPTSRAPVETGAPSAPALAPPPPAEPFPADKLERESKEVAKRDAASAAGAVAESAPPTPRSEPRRQAQQTTNSPGTQPVTAFKQPAQDAAAGGPQSQDIRSYTQDQSPAKAFAAQRAKVAPKLSVPDWIELIRKLRDEGRTDEAAKELVAFRNAHADHEQLLPPDLRDWKPTP